MNTPKAIVIAVVKALFNLAVNAATAALVVATIAHPSFGYVLACLYLVPFAVRRS